MAEKKTLDCRGLACPQPVIQTKEMLAGMAPGVLRVLVDNEAARGNVLRFASSQGHAVEEREEAGGYTLLIQKELTDELAEPVTIVCPEFAPERMAVYIHAEGMGRGDEGLGAVLIKAYMETLLHFANRLSHILLVNGGVKLACAGSPVLEHLRELAGMEVEILACGACLKHFGLEDKLGVGVVSNMYTIVEAMAKSSKVLSP